MDRFDHAHRREANEAGGSSILSEQTRPDSGAALPLRYSAGYGALFSTAIFLSAVLVFWVQPLIGRTFLPILGGKPAVWNACLFFFQTLLLGGYVLSHFLTRWCSITGQVLLQASALLLAGLLLPVHLGVELLHSVPTEDNPSWWLLRALFLTAGPPFLLLCANGPLLQYWFARLAPSRDPYVLYAASNAGSLLALCASPTLLDPRAGIELQLFLWAGFYALLLPLVLVCGWLAARAQTQPFAGGSSLVANLPVSAPQPGKIPWRDRLMWLGLAFVPVSLMMAVTSYISSDIATIPLFWVLPLALYLLTFVIAFAQHGALPVRLANRLAPILTLVLVYAILSEANDPPWLLLALHLLYLFCAALSLNGRLAFHRPDSRHLTEFFLWVGFGGMLAGFFNALIAPLLFTTVAEYPIAVLLAAFLFQRKPAPIPPAQRRREFLFAATLGLLTIAASRSISFLPMESVQWRPALAFGVPVALAYILVDRRWPFTLALAAIFCASHFYPPAQGTTLYRLRNFFGVSRVSVDRSGKFRRLVHGNTLHGIQAVAATTRCEPLAYYHPSGPLGHLFTAFHAAPAGARVAVVGLGLGSMICYAEPGESWDFYEIDPGVVKIAQDTNYFTYLKNKPIPDLRIIMGDARLRLAEAPRGHYGLIILDAFSSDAIPVHLLSTEAIALYLSKLAPGGLLLFHISNRYLDLEPVLSSLSLTLHLPGVVREDTEEKPEKGIEPSQWAVLARSRQDLGRLLKDARWIPLETSSMRPPWTDDFSDVLGIFRWK